jgi:hypothetical protein
MVPDISSPEPDAKVSLSRLEGERNFVAGMKTDSDTRNSTTKSAL